LFVTASLGAAVGPRDGADADRLFKCADAALHHAKQQGRNGFRFYSAELGAAAERRLALLGELRHALERGQFCIHYQPQRRFADGTLAGAEALLRWQHPQLGLVAPAEFVPLLEETGLIVPVGEWVLERVCTDMARLERVDIPPLQVSVNLSVRQFHQQDLAGRIAAILERQGVAAARLTVEITESLLMDDPEKSVCSLRQLKQIGVHVAVDDFGTGYSSLSYLKKFPVDELKIDRSFVAGVACSREDAAIIDAAIHMAHNLGMQVVAEGVEDARQWEFLKAHGCDCAQGYLVGRPSDFDVFLGQLGSKSVEGAIHPESGPRPAPIR
ncbi:MAG TPA: GGDEF domain-containing phosphodiesterase, partial [Gammaproteobacteria bacterium]|nr:GGDEF domain-containing phosphodiesterase [Gammaproteobacteria bacterium]